MKTILCLLLSVALAPFVACAQSNPYGVDPNSQVAANQRAEEAQRQQLQQTRAIENQRSQTTGTSSGGTFFRRPRYGQMLTGKTAEERRQAKQRKANERAYQADLKAHDGWKSYPGGYRGKNGKMMRPDGTIVGE